MRIDFRSVTFKLLIVIFLGLVLRFIFTFFIARSYFGRENIYLDYDFWAWANSFENFIKYGTFTFDLNNPYGYFGRMPGYSMFIGIFYLITGNWQDALPVIGITQIFLDCLAIYLLFKIGQKIFKNDGTSLLISFMYATYPFIIVWNPVAYSESASIFFILLFLFLFLKNTPLFMFFAGAALSFAIQCRPQILILIPLSFLWFYYFPGEKKYIIRKITFYLVAILLFYGSWPVRNYLLYNKIVLTQDIRAFKTAGDDWLSFCQYLYSVKTDFEPQFSQIIKNQKVEMPLIAYSVPGDSVKLEKALALSKECGSSFSHWRGYWKKPFDEPNCNREIAQLFDELRESQKKNNPFNYYISVPLQNLQKALFKFRLNNATGIRNLASLLFIYRTFLIFIGITGLIWMYIRRNNRPFVIFIFVYFVILYLLLCAGTGPQLRNIEMRYFLPADILLLIPAAALIQHLWLYSFSKLKNR